MALSESKVFCSRDFTLLPDFLSLSEQRILLATALQKLDATDGRLFRRLRKGFESSKPPSLQHSALDMFLPDEYYRFEEGHCDGVIHHFREMTVQEWPEVDVPGLSSILERLYGLCPTFDRQTHILHLASRGEILPHIDNVTASGSWILGVSLGAERIMRMEGSEGRFDVLLPSGSVYLQKDTVRYGCTHSILKEGSFLGRKISGGQRLSLMIRDRLRAVS